MNVFGIPFRFMPSEAEADANPKPPQPPPKTVIEPDPAKARFEISWPNVIRVEHQSRPRLSPEWKSVETLDLDAAHGHA